MSGNKALLDSNVFIYISKNQLDIDKLLANYDAFCISVITKMEILGFNFDYEEQKLILETLLKHIESITINDAIVEKVIEIRKLRKIKLPDAIIYATAAVAGVDLITRNTDDFKGLGTSVNVIDPFDF